MHRLEANKTLAAQFLSHLAAMDLDQAFALTRDVQWWTANGALTPAILQSLQERLRPHVKGPMTIEILTTTAEGNRVAVEARSYQELINGRTYRNNYHFLFEVEDGAIVKINEHQDTRHAAEVFGDILQ